MSNRARVDQTPPLPRGDAGGDGAGDDLLRHGGHRIRLGVTWNTVRRNIFNWKPHGGGNLEAKVKSFCAVPQVLRVLKDFHPLRGERGGAAKVHPALQPSDGRGGQGGGAALDPQRLARAGLAHAGQRQDLHDDQAARCSSKRPKAGKPTILLMIDRNELEHHDAQ